MSLVIKWEDTLFILTHLTNFLNQFSKKPVKFSNERDCAQNYRLNPAR
jgi:hypothetical protein